VIKDSECVGVSFPEFFKTLERLRGGEVQEKVQEDLRK
jgi:5-enolpyruvylshikimate-3-phosphate synthase